ncbi:MAG TPA: glycosyltransferase family 2 protein [Longimicrobiaceae bacterium]
MRLSVILSTYNQPAWLEKALWGFAAQTLTGFEVVIADDGSGPETAALIERMRAETGLPIRHVWHEDRGFRKCEILNRAVVASAGDYLVFSDGDCVPRRDFLAVHARLAEPGRFLSGGYLKLPRLVSERITPAEIRSGRAFEVDWLREQGWKPGHRALRLLPPGPAALLDRLTTTRPTWNGHNASAAREALLRANGYDIDMGYGGEDRALGERLQNLGLRGRQIRFRAPCLHLYHERPYVDPAVIRENRRIRAAIRSERRTRARQGIAELTSDAV